MLILFIKSLYKREVSVRASELNGNCSHTGCLNSDQKGVARSLILSAVFVCACVCVSMWVCACVRVCVHPGIMTYALFNQTSPNTEHARCLEAHSRFSPQGLLCFSTEADLLSLTLTRKEPALWSIAAHLLSVPLIHWKSTDEIRQ